ncbi:MAG TPA: sensor histidine kinase [Candidatus Ventrousia excrementavium]|uniref:histidine kinase n=1 Tax=Candidatus Ventrousia excrementavium TaxID=2840961 RepID=A0A9D1IVP9_9CLOT|nr:sensor histidine kinase [Candidatus Ventrousia excrementavium]
MIRRYLRHRRVIFSFFAVFSLFFTLLLYLYSGGLDAASYYLLIAGFLFSLWVAIDSRSFARRMHMLDDILQNISAVRHDFPLPSGPLEEVYQDIALELFRLLNRKTSALEAAHADQLFYYTRWLHQIKTPIAAIRLAMQAGKADSAVLEQELFKIEQYVEMALQYVKLQDISTDLIIRDTDILPVVRECVKKYASLFIYKGLSVSITGDSFTAATDEKWLAFVIEQLLSNAVKYTSRGGVAITLADRSITIRDDGIGILPEDAARIFEKGYTGTSGRADKRASGIGLFMVHEIADRLAIELSVESVPGQGTAVRLALPCSDSLTNL